MMDLSLGITFTLVPQIAFWAAVILYNVSQYIGVSKSQF